VRRAGVAVARTLSRHGGGKARRGGGEQSGRRRRGKRRGTGCLSRGVERTETQEKGGVAQLVSGSAWAVVGRVEQAGYSGVG
jgi:hypothetical protein